MSIQDCPLEQGAFAEVGGALKFGLMSALTALRLSDGTIFDPAASSRVRAEIEPQFRYAAFCATLASVPMLVHHHVHIEIDATAWSLTSGENLYERGTATGYEVSWNPVTPQRPSAALGSVLLLSLFTPGQFAHLKPEVVLALCEAINPACIQKPAETSLGKIVRVAQEKTRASEKERVGRLFGSPESMVSSLKKIPDPATGELLPESSAAQTAQIWAQPSPPEIVTPAESVVSSEIRQWVKAVTQGLPSEISFVGEDKVRVSRKALNFGIAANLMYQKIHAEGLVDSKVEDGFFGGPVLRAEFQKHMGAK